MAYDATCIPTDEARAETPLAETGQFSEEIDERRAYGSGGAKLGDFIAVIESRTFIRECISPKRAIGVSATGAYLFDGCRTGTTTSPRLATTNYTFLDGR
jgi:hypothetical protein